MIQVFMALLLGYVAGSIPSGVIVTRLAGAPDPRDIGSKNIGATNVLRTGRKDLAAITLVADALKGTLPTFVAAHLDSGSSVVPLAIGAALGAFLGHLFPLFLGFRGGKGVATFVGCLISLAWPAALAFAAVWLATAYVTRFSSAAALAASAVTPCGLAALGKSEGAVLFAVLATALWVTHRANIGRLLDGTESRIGRAKSVSAA